MIIKTVVPRIGDKMLYIGKPIKDEKRNTIGFITDVIEDDWNFELIITDPRLTDYCNDNVKALVDLHNCVVVSGDVLTSVENQNYVNVKQNSKHFKVTFEEACENFKNSLKGLKEIGYDEYDS